MNKTLLTLALLAAATTASAEPWKYSGSLNDGGAPANGRYDLRLTLLDAVKAMSIGSPVTLHAINVHDGAFTVDVDFGIDLANAPAMQLKTEVSKGSSAFVALGEPTRFDPKAALAGVCWDTEGNSGTNPATNFLGTIDNKPLMLRAYNNQIARFEPDGSVAAFGDAPRVTMGSSANQATAVGATVSGGGSTRDQNGIPDSSRKNSATEGFSTVGGGTSNTASGQYSSVGGGLRNLASGIVSTVAGGIDNRAIGDFSVVTGGSVNCAGGNYSWAGGYFASVRPGNVPGNLGCGLNVQSSGTATGDEGTFIWADTSQFGFNSTGPNQFLVRATGGVGINTATLGNAFNLRLSELVIKNPAGAGQENTDVSLMSQSSNRGYGIAVVPAGNGTSAGDFYISEVDARTPTVGFANRFRIDAAGTTFVQGGAVGNLSDARLKKNIGPIPRPLDQLLALQGHMFEYIDPAKAMNALGPRMGFVAQEVQTVLPNWVKPTGNEGYLAVTPIGFEALAVEAIRDLKAESDVSMELLKQENIALKAKVAAQGARLDALEASLAPRH